MVALKDCSVPPTGVIVPLTCVTTRGAVQFAAIVNVPVTPAPENGASVTPAYTVVPAMMVTATDPVAIVVPVVSFPLTVSVQSPADKLLIVNVVEV